MKINVGFAVFIDVIEFEPFLGENIQNYIEAFDKWYFEDSDISGIVTHHAKEKHIKRFKYFDGNVIIAWMNEVAPKCNARIVQYHIPPEQEDLTLPSMYF